METMRFLGHSQEEVDEVQESWEQRIAEEAGAFQRQQNAEVVQVNSSGSERSPS